MKSELWLLNTLLEENVSYGGSLQKQIYYMNLDEQQKVQISDKLVEVLYADALKNYNEMDFGSIPASKGYIEKVQGFDTVSATVQNLDDLCKQQGVFCPELETVKTAISNMILYKSQFAAAFLQDAAILKMLYNSLVAGIISTTSLLVAGMVEFIRTPNGDLTGLTLSKYTKTDLSKSANISALSEFNKMVQEGKFKVLCNTLLKDNKFMGEVITFSAVTVATILLIYYIVQIIRLIIFEFMSVRMDISMYLKHQAMFLKLNASRIQAQGGNVKVAKKQLAYAEQFEKMSDKIEVKFKGADKSTKKEMDKKVDISKVVDSSTNNDFNFM